MRSALARKLREERGQTLLLAVGMTTVILLMAAIVIDAGLWLAQRRAVHRAVDFAALAGAQQLLVDDAAAQNDALAWAAKNGFADGVDGASVTVELLCTNDLGGASGDICSNPNAPAPSACAAGSGCDGLRVRIEQESDLLFSSIFGIDPFDIGATATAGLAVDQVVSDTALVLDASGSMLSGCNSTQSNETCPIKLARDAANRFVDILLRRLSLITQVGYIPFNWCYDPPGGHFRCQPEERVVDLTGDGAPLHAQIDDTIAGTSTNICFGLLRSLWMLTGSGAQSDAVHRTVVLISDGDNNYSTQFIHAQNDYPPWPCRTTPSNTNNATPSQCLASWAQERELDVKTYQVATSLKNAGAEIYVVGLDVCGTDDGRTRLSPGYCGGIGDIQHDNIADQRLLKCIASSPAHFSRTTTLNLEDALRDLALSIAGRELVQ